jgi:MFS family permease
MREILRSRTLLSAAVAYAAAITASNLIPLQVAAFATRQHLNDEQIGTVALCEVMGLALTTIFATALSRHVGRIAGIAGPAFVAAGQIVSLWLPGMLSLCIVRALVGVGCGLAGAIVARAIAASRASAAAFGLANGLSAVMIGSLLAVIPWFPSANPGVRVFVPLALLGALIAVTAHVATREMPIADHRARGDGSTDATRTILIAPALALCVATLLIYIPLGGIWTFSVQLGVRLGLSERHVGGLLIFAVFGGLVGGAAAAWTEEHVGIVRSLLLGAASCVASCIAVGSARGAWSFGVAFCLYSGAYQFAISALQVVGAMADTRGRVPAILLGVTLVGYAIGSYLVGYLLDIERPQLIWTAGGWACALAIVPSLMAVRGIAAAVRQAAAAAQSDAEPAREIR